jgi:hypothetical protein
LTSPFADFVNILQKPSGAFWTANAPPNVFARYPNFARVAIVTGEGRANKEETDKHLFGPPG